MVKDGVFVTAKTEFDGFVAKLKVPNEVSGVILSTDIDHLVKGSENLIGINGRRALFFLRFLDGDASG